MAKLGNVPYRKVARALKRLGFSPIRQKGGHIHFMHPDGRFTTVPFHSREPIGPRLLTRIMESLKQDAEEFRRML